MLSFFTSSEKPIFLPAPSSVAFDHPRNHVSRKALSAWIEGSLRFYPKQSIYPYAQLPTKKEKGVRNFLVPKISPPASRQRKREIVNDLFFMILDKYANLCVEKREA